MTTINYYEMLGVDQYATAEEIKKSYRELAKKHHPDKGGNEEEFKKINEAYSILSNDEKRMNYDRDFFFINARQKAFEEQQKRALDIYQTLVITLKECYTGASKKVRLGGNVIDIEIPKGANNGFTVKIAGQGNRFKDLIGDMYIRIYVDNSYNTSNVYLVSDFDLETIIDVPLIDFIKSKSIPINIWDTYICNIKLPGGQNSDVKLRIPNKGLYSHALKKNGDLFVKLRINIPKYDDLADSAKEKIDELEGLI